MGNRSSGNPSAHLPKVRTDGGVGFLRGHVLAGNRVYTSATDTGRVIPGIRGDVQRWAPDGGSVLVQSGRFEVTRVDVASGRVTPLLDLTPGPGSTAVQLVGIAFADDLRHYVYGLGELGSVLFSLKGAR